MFCIHNKIDGCHACANPIGIRIGNARLRFLGDGDRFLAGGFVEFVVVPWLASKTLFSSSRQPMRHPATMPPRRDAMARGDRDHWRMIGARNEQCPAWSDRVEIFIPRRAGSRHAACSNNQTACFQGANSFYWGDRVKVKIPETPRFRWIAPRHRASRACPDGQHSGAIMPYGAAPNSGCSTNPGPEISDGPQLLGQKSRMAH
jgi:hypothetical protein